MVIDSTKQDQLKSRGEKAEEDKLTKTIHWAQTADIVPTCSMQGASQHKLYTSAYHISKTTAAFALRTKIGRQKGYLRREHRQRNQRAKETERNPMRGKFADPKVAADEAKLAREG